MARINNVKINLYFGMLTIQVRIRIHKMPNPILIIFNAFLFLISSFKLESDTDLFLIIKKVKIQYKKK
jgi:hypothetical protein